MRTLKGLPLILLSAAFSVKNLREEMLFTWMSFLLPPLNAMRSAKPPLLFLNTL